MVTCIRPEEALRRQRVEESERCSWGVDGAWQATVLMVGNLGWQRWRVPVLRETSRSPEGRKTRSLM